MARIKVSVTQEDIDYATRQSMHNCPLARAMSRTLGRKVSVLPGMGWKFITGAFESLSFSRRRLLSRSARRFALAFDEGRSVKPFNFFVEV